MSKITYLELQPNTFLEQMADLDIDNKMALQLEKKLSKVLSNNGCNNNTTTQNNVSSCNNSIPVSNTNEIFNISKTKKIDLQNLSSRLEPNATMKEIQIDTTETKTSTSTENQSTVIISFKPSQIPIHIQPHTKSSIDKAVAIHSTPNAEKSPALTETSLSLACNTPSPSSTTSYGFSTPSSNVLKKVVSFTVEKTSTGAFANENSVCNPSVLAAHVDNVCLRRLSYVPEKLCFAAYEKFEGQMLIKWLVSSVQMNRFNEQDINTITIQYCNNLLKIGVLKQISESDNADAFSPFHMYQWTYREVPCTSLPLTPRKIDKTAVWPYNSPTSNARIAKCVQVDLKTKDNTFNQTLRSNLLNCSTLEEVRKVTNELFNVEESKLSKLYARYSSDTNINVFEDKSSSSPLSVDTKEVITENKKVLAEINEICTCKNVIKKKTVQMFEKSVQTDIPTEKETKLIVDKPIPIPPPPPKPILNKNMKPTYPPPPPAVHIPDPPGILPPIPPAIPSTINGGMIKQNVNIPPVPPAPLPNATESGWFNQTTLRKTAVNPPKPMKPLYWTRIVTNLPQKKEKSTNQQSQQNHDEIDVFPDESLQACRPKEIWQEIEETHLDNIEEFTELFSRQAVVPICKPKEKKDVKIKTIKVLDSKRSQNVGIVSRSLHVDFCEIEHAIYHVDTSVVSLETLQQIINVKATSEELELIKEAALSEIPLDHPERFLLKIAQISMSTERISCIVFQAEFEEATILMTRKLDVVMQLSHYLIESEELKLVFSIILTLGNYMNGGNRQRGQADGFTLEILGKLKDVKSKDSHITLLHFIVRTYISRRRNEGIQLLKIPLPIPEPSDIERATQVDLDEIKLQVTELKKKLNACRKTTEKVLLAATAETLEPFKTKMENFIENATKMIDTLFNDIEKCREAFLDTMRFYHFMPKSGTLDQCTPDQFFEYWTNFTNDFKDIWKKEIAALHDDLMKKTKQIQSQSRKNIKTTKIKPGGLKERIMRLSKK